MTHEHEQHEHPAAGHLTFATGGVVSGDGAPIETRIPAGEHVLSQDEAAALMALRTAGEHVAAANFEATLRRNGNLPPEPFEAVAARGHQHERNVPDGARVMPSGHWVMLKDPHTLTRGDKRELIKSGQANENQSPAERIFMVADLVHAKLITGWSYSLPLPSQDPDSLNRIPLEDDGAFDDLIDEANKLLFPKSVSPDDHADPNSPTAPSGE